MFSVDGKDQQQMQPSFTMHKQVTSPSLPGNITLLMLDLVHVTPCLFHTEVFTIILQSGEELLFGKKKNLNHEELFNLRCASTRNVIEQIFGSFENSFSILTHPPEYDMDIQAHLPPSKLFSYSHLSVLSQACGNTMHHF